MPIDPKSIVVGATFTSSRWKGDRKVTRRVFYKDVKKNVVTQHDEVHFVDQRTGRTGMSPVKVFAAMADGPGLVVTPR